MKKTQKFLNCFIPHPETHQKAHLLSWHALIIYILLFILLRVGIDLVGLYKPGVLGVNANITPDKIITQTNEEREKKGLSPLVENQALSLAAREKAQNMFEENYWAHYSPSGRDPWKFILSSGYKFSYAGENLARNFYNSSDVVRAWMASSSHRDNILNPNYQDIGIAVIEGVLNGQKTTLVVQMFAKPSENIAAAPQINLGGRKIALASEANSSQPILVAGVQNLTPPALLDPLIIMKIGGLVIFSLIALLLALDFLILRKRGVFRLSSHHLAHLSFLAIAAASLVLNQGGEIL